MLHSLCLDQHNYFLITYEHGCMVLNNMCCAIMCIQARGMDSVRAGALWKMMTRPTHTTPTDVDLVFFALNRIPTQHHRYFNQPQASLQQRYNQQNAADHEPLDIFMGSDMEDPSEMPMPDNEQPAMQLQQHTMTDNAAQTWQHTTDISARVSSAQVELGQHWTAMTHAAEMHGLSLDDMAVLQSLIHPNQAGSSAMATMATSNRLEPSVQAAPIPVQGLSSDDMAVLQSLLDPSVPGSSAMHRAQGEIASLLASSSIRPPRRSDVEFEMDMEAAIAASLQH